MGLLGLCADEFCPSLEDYLVLEIPEVVQRFQAAADGPLRFQAFLDYETTLSGGSGHVDVVYSNSALQYAPDNTVLCEVVSHFAPRLVLLDELLWHSGTADWFSLQVNSDVPVPCRFTSLSKLESDMRQVGYTIAWSGSFGGAGGYGFPSMQGFDESRRISSALSLLFTRGDSDT